MKGKSLYENEWELIFFAIILFVFSTISSLMLFQKGWAVSIILGIIVTVITVGTIVGHEEEKRRKKNQEIEIRQMKDKKKLFKSWEPIPWKDYTGSIIKTKAELWGSYDETFKSWNKKDMELKFLYYKDWYLITLDTESWERITNRRKFGFKRMVRIKGREVTIFHYDENWYYSDDEINIYDAGVLIDETNLRRKEKLNIEIAKHREDNANNGIFKQKERVSEYIKIHVWRRDEGKCVKCGSNHKLEYDHIIPISKGGNNTARNIQLLCESCNRTKGAKNGR